ncbi:hypothetical protein [Anditalea andensis]|uniref:Small multi-drug export protein n=1 Tax=Anditalea andensis TaxID=1048983 RepID=A0A074KVB9_9BACT|nr:hypothetical protein [Anditalea andensis]KEO72879.1 hypothetical protein EL17_14730 [Anditalea andensis]
MTAYVLKFLGIYVICLFKFIGGPVLGTAAGYSVFEIVIVTVLGLMSSVIAFTYIGSFLKTTYHHYFQPRRKLFNSKTRKMVHLWQKFGAIGVAAMTPIILSPIGGAILMNAFGVKRKKILLYMLVSGIFWSSFFALTIDHLRKIPIVSGILN